MQGILNAFNGRNQLLVSVTLLQRAVAVEIDSAYVTLIERASATRAEKTFFQGRQTLLPT
jgi:hypothetical protein